MAAASCTLTGTIKDITGMAMDPSRVVVQLVATVQMILDSTVGEMRVGQKQVKPDAQGRWTFTNVWLTDTADTNPASFRWRLVLQAWPDSASPSVTYQTSDFPITSTGVINIKDVDFVPVDPDPGWKSIFQSQMEAWGDDLEASVAATQAAMQTMANNLAAMWEASVMPTKMLEYNVGQSVNFASLYPGFAYADVELWHGSTGGGFGNTGMGGGGASGSGRNFRRFYASEMTGAVSLVIGAAGAGGVYPSTAATQGGLSSFGTWSPSTFLPSAAPGNGNTAISQAGYGGAPAGVISGTAGTAFSGGGGAGVDGVGNGGSGAPSTSGTSGPGGKGGGGLRGGGGGGAGGSGNTGGAGGASDEGGGGGAGGGTTVAAGGASSGAGKGGNGANATTAATAGTAPGGGGAGGYGTATPYCNGSAGAVGRIRVTLHWV